MKFGAVYCLYDDHEFLQVSVDGIKKYLNKILFLISDVPWNGKVSDNSSTINFVKELCRKDSRFQLIQGHWINEVEQRNFGLDNFYKDGIDYGFVIDNDEIYHEQHVKNIIDFVKKNPKHSAFHIEWNTYWSKKYYAISPRENFQPLILVKVSNFEFTGIRMGTTGVIRSSGFVFRTLETYNGILIPPQIAFCFHMSYARTDEFIKRKLETNSHAPEFISNWYENVWLKWTPEKRNLHPVTPQQYNVAVQESFMIFPDNLKTFIKKERFKNNICSIVVLNWNSCELLKRCLSLVQKNTKGKRYEIIIVDNGSTKDNSVGYLQSLNKESYKFPFKIIYNKENLGFPGGMNVGINAADKNSDICLLNVDAEVQEGWLIELYKTLIRFSNCGLVGPLGNDVPSRHQCEGYVKDDTLTPNLHFYCVLIMRELVDKIGLLDTIYGLGGYDDNDYGTRARLAGYDIYISAKSLVKHQAHQVFKLNDLNYYDLDDKNRAIFLEKFYGILHGYSRIYDLYKFEDVAKQLKLIIR